jgi:hypothetical protein
MRRARRLSRRPGLRLLPAPSPATRDARRATRPRPERRGTSAAGSSRAADHKLVARGRDRRRRVTRLPQLVVVALTGRGETFAHAFSERRCLRGRTDACRRRIDLGPQSASGIVELGDDRHVGDAVPHRPRGLDSSGDDLRRGTRAATRARLRTADQFTCAAADGGTAAEIPSAAMSPTSSVSTSPPVALVLASAPDRPWACRFDLARRSSVPSRGGDISAIRGGALAGRLQTAPTPAGRLGGVGWHTVVGAVGIAAAPCSLRGS